MRFSTVVSRTKHASKLADHLSAEDMGWDITRYADMLPKKILTPGSKASNKKEASLKQRYPPLNGVTASKPCIVVDMQGIILTWYLPGILTDSRQAGLFAQSDCSGKSDVLQAAMLAAQEKLRPLQEKLPSGKSWRNDRKYFHPGEGTHNCTSFSPAWFQQGHDVSAWASRI
jgi:hypothetical protein